ncbi:MAG: right-handed parallel beta-helix repeat-containing protein [Phycisphaerales bacterium]|nr:right-handed parallel beta-helix repeat-containing protein [Phycisphaerales bacterium]
MNPRGLVLMQAAVFGWVIAAGAGAQGIHAVAKEFYVGQYSRSPSSAYADNSTARPFADMQTALTQVRAWLAATPDHGEVYVRVAGGEYRIERPLIFTPADSGTEEFPVRWVAWDGAPGQAPDDDVLVSGGLHMDRGWAIDPTVAVPNANVWKAPLAAYRPEHDLPAPRSLWYDGMRLIRARFPNPPESPLRAWPADWPAAVLSDPGLPPPNANEGFLITSEVIRDVSAGTQTVVVGNGLDPSDPGRRERRDYELPRIDNWQGVELVGFNGYVSPRQIVNGPVSQENENPGRPGYFRDVRFTFTIEKRRIPRTSGLDPDTDYQDLGGFGVFDLEDGFGFPPKKYGQRLLQINGERNPLGPLRPAQVVLENHFAFLDRAGEWYCDRANLWIVLPRGDDPNPSGVRPGVVLPLVQKLLVLDGTRCVTFTGIDWAYADMPFPVQGWPGENVPGYATTQSGWQWQDRDRNYDVTNALPAAVELRGARRVEFASCRFGHFDGSGITIGQRYDAPAPNEYLESSDNTITRCEVFDTGGHGIDIGDQRTQERNGWAAGAHLPTRPEPHDNNVVTQSYIHHYGVTYKDGAGILIAHTRNTTISHNCVELGNWSGMAIGDLQRHQYTGDYPDCSCATCSNPAWPRTNEHVLVRGNLVQKTCLRLNDGGGIYMMGSQRLAPDGPMSELDGNYIRLINHDPYKNYIHYVMGLYFDGGSDGWVVRNNVIADAQYPFRFAARRELGTDREPSPATAWGAAAWPVPWIPACNVAPPIAWPGQEWSVTEPNWWLSPGDAARGYASVTNCPGYFPMAHSMAFPEYPGPGTPQNWTIRAVGDGGSREIMEAAGPENFNARILSQSTERIANRGYRHRTDTGEPSKEIEWTW